MDQTIEIKDVEEIKSEEVINDHNDIFITEDDTFDINIKWYKEDGNLYVEDSDTTFDTNYPSINEFTVTIKYPSQGDYETIMSNASYKSPDEMKIADVVQMELVRFITLIRKWSLKQDLSKMVELDPSIIKAILSKVRNKLGMKGII
jgi:hypothetical protein